VRRFSGRNTHTRPSSSLMVRSTVPRLDKVNEQPRY
jgi:hypothetical protein